MHAPPQKRKKTMMEDKQLNEKESLELIARMIQNTRHRLERNAGMPFLVWGYATVAVSLLVWYMLKETGNPYWNFLWFLIPLVGVPTMLWQQRKKVKTVKTYIDRVINYVWIVFGTAGFVVSCTAMFLHHLPILFICMLLMGMGTALTGLISGIRGVTISGAAGALTSLACFLIPGSGQILLFAAAFLFMMVIPGHAMNRLAAKKTH